MANMSHVIKVKGKVCEITKQNPNNLEVDFYGNKATFWPGSKRLVLKNSIDGKYISLPA